MKSTQQEYFFSIRQFFEEVYALEKQYNDVVLKLTQAGRSDEIQNSVELKAIEDQIEKLYEERYILKPDEMRFIIDAKKTKREQEHKSLQCEVFESIDGPDFKKSLSNILKNKDALIGQRFQVVIQSENHHWSAADILVSEDGIQILHFDSVDRFNPLKEDDFGGRNTKELERVLISIRNNPDIPKSIPVKIVETYVSNGNAKLQHDYKSCSIFALNAALTMSKIENLHELLNKNNNKMRKNGFEVNNVTTFSLSTNYLPAPLLKNSQDLNVVARYEAMHKDDDLNRIIQENKIKTLLEYVQGRTHQVGMGDNEVPSTKNKTSLNMGVQYTRERFIKILENAKSQTIFGSSSTNESSNEQSPPDSTSKPKQ